MANLTHAHKPAIEALRDIMRSVDAAIVEEVKWNAPSYRTSEYFATMHLRPDQPIGLVLHLGAKAREDPNLEIGDPDRLLHWLARDRAIVRFAGLDEVRARASSLQRLVRQWIVYV